MVELAGRPFFVAKDVCDALSLPGYASQHTKRLDKEELYVVKRDSRILSTRHVPELFKSKAPSVTLISESGLYKLIMRSDKPEALAFQNWVTKVVLPAIRKDGATSLLRKRPQGGTERRSNAVRASTIGAQLQTD